MAKSQETLFRLLLDPECPDEKEEVRPITFTRPEVLDRDPDLCAMCDNRAASELLMGVKSCKTCYLFLCTSLDKIKLSLSYCCPKGEFGVLCKLKDRERCSYCWLRRCEIEGRTFLLTEFVLAEQFPRFSE